MASFMYRSRNIRGIRSLRKRYDSDEENVQLDYERDPRENVREILTHIVKREGVTKGCKLGYLNSFVKLFTHIGPEADMGFSLEEIFCCLRVTLLHEAVEVRAATLRTIRYLIRRKESVRAFCSVQLPFLVTRCLDIVLDNRLERVHALRLIRRILAVNHENFPASLTRCLVAIVNDGTHEKDHLVKASLGTLSELALMNPDSCAETGVLRAIIHSILDCQSPQIGESLVGVILFLINNSRSRQFIKTDIDLERILGPFTDPHFRYSADTVDHAINEDKETRFTTARLALTAVLRSWPGLVYLCKPNSSGLQSLIDVLYLPYSDIRRNIMDLFFDLFCLPSPEWTDDFSVAILSADPSVMQHSWQLYEGFVAAEGRDILPHVAKHRTNFVENYLALLLFAFVQIGVLEALVAVIVCDDPHLSVRATILLGELLYMASSLLPPECSHHCHCLPSLMSHAASFETFPQKRNQASTAITYLNRMHSLKKRGVVPCSLFLDQLLQFCSPIKKQVGFSGSSRHSAHFRQYLKKTSEDIGNQAIKDTQVTIREYTCWDWDLIGSILKVPWPGDVLYKLDDSSHKNFIKKLLHFYKPTSKQFSLIEADKEHGRQICVVGCQLIDFLLEADETKSYELLDEFLTDLNLCLSQITLDSAPLQAILSPTRVLSTLSHAYFLFIGRMSNSSKGRKLLERSGVFQHLLNLVSLTNHDTYVKLVISSLDYTKEGFTRTILTKVLTATSEVSRLYATNYLRVLLRAQLPEFSKWAVELLVTQLYDKSRAVSLAAADILDEACDNQKMLEALISLRPSLLHVGDKGLLLLLRFLSIPKGYRFLRDANFINHELERWRNSYNLKYVKIVEDTLNEGFTHHRRGEDGTYGRSSTSIRVSVRSSFVPPHMYGQLAQHQDGLDFLVQSDCLHPLFNVIHNAQLDNNHSILQLKAALWAVGHLGTSHLGASHVIEADVLPWIVRLAAEAPVFSVRGTCFYVLGLLCTTPVGSDILSRFGWEAVRHNHEERWPIVKDKLHIEDIMSDESRPYSCSISSEESHFNELFWFGRQNLVSSSPTFLLSTPEKEDIPFVDDVGDHSCVLYGSSANTSYPTNGQRTLTLTSDFFEDGDVTNSWSYIISKKSFSPQHKRSISDGRPRSSSDGKPFLKRTNVVERVDVGDQMTLTTLSIPQSSQERINSINEGQDGVTGNDTLMKGRSVSSSEVQKSPGLRRIFGPKDERSDSNESSQTSVSKSRSDSCTDSTTSGVSSCDSTTFRAPHLEHAQTLSPIPSSTSLNTMASRTYALSESSHYRLSLCQQSVPRWHHSQIFSSTSPEPSSPVSFTYTSVRDAIGYVALRAIQRPRVQSLSLEGDNTYTILNGYRSAKTRSLDPCFVSDIFMSNEDENQFEKSARRTSLSSQVTIKSNESKSSEVPVDEKYIGLCLPVDINLIFSHGIEQKMRSKKISVISSASTISRSELSWKQYQEMLSSSEDAKKAEGLELHTKETCLACYRVHKEEVIQITGTTNSESEEGSSKIEGRYLCSPCQSGAESPIPQIRKIVKSRANSFDSATATTPGSLASSGSTDGLSNYHLKGPTSLSEKRKEVLRLVNHLSSSIAVKGAEQGLLNLKQKYPNTFQDVCLYSEICLQMARYNFRLTARRFLQELFFDMKFEQVYEEAESVLASFSLPVLPPSSESKA
ncbi:rapamycin-insensitive companion of Tor isoform X1 [Tachypleus tridentatus]|uniref:rapamycin-insensitive companion of Tor isoform X1 n=1 Tax=Tachypleus tridentatus TaxID=6853 RepID=UPI003FD08D35